MAGMINLPPYTFRDGKDFLSASLCFALHATLSLYALSGMNIPMYGAIKRCSPLVSFERDSDLVIKCQIKEYTANFTLRFYIIKVLFFTIKAELLLMFLLHFYQVTSFYLLLLRYP